MTENGSGSAQTAHSLSPQKLRALPPDGGAEYNRLIFEKSPYLLQHARNPVDWFPWGKDAFVRAAAESKPVFLSIGYAACHWCHVMERESFEDPEVAALLNESFVSVKVDREERPDIDKIYMAACQAMTRSGGWPLTVIMTPERTPFFAGTYFPRTGRHQRPGMLELLPRIAELWSRDPEACRTSGERAAAALRQMSAPESGAELRPGAPARAFEQLRERFDADRGGFGAAPKFPAPHQLLFLFRYGQRTGLQKAAAMAEKTLQQIRLGGIYDHVGFGVHRYSTDGDWLVPHFEKMLYDQAMLTLAFVEAYQAAGKRAYAETARELFTYVLRDMTSPQGGFYSSQDADSQGEEGRFYLWELQELQRVLSREEAGFVCRHFNVEAAGNFTDQAAGQKTGGNVLHLTESFAAAAAKQGTSVEELEAEWQTIREKLFRARAGRVQPPTDDKILTDWNGLMIAALARGGAVLAEPAYVRAAAGAADFIWNRMRAEDGRLLKRFREHEAGLPAHLEDYAFFIWGLIELYEADFDAVWLQRALELQAVLERDFLDDEHGGFYFSAAGSADLILRPREIWDDATPSGNSAACLNLLRLSRLTGASRPEDLASGIFRAFSRQVEQFPMAAAHLMTALLYAEGSPCEVVISGPPDSAHTRDLLRAAQQHYAPDKVVLFRPSGVTAPLITKLSPFTEACEMINGKPTAYVCKNRACARPVNERKEMLALLNSH